MNKQVISIQTILFNHDVSSVERWIESISNSVANAKKVHESIRFNLYLGDCSDSPIFTDGQIKSFNDTFPLFNKIEYVFFNDNLGSAKGHNTLAMSSNSEYLMTVNPDTVMAPSCIKELLDIMADEQTGIAEANQIPLEHPKEFDILNGETSWASTCCALIRRKAYDEVSGFDDKHFFLHCDDVDFSWQVRLAGYRVRLNPKALIFHEHGFDEDNKYVSTSAERRYSAIGALMLFAKYGRKDLLDSTLEHFNENKNDYGQVLADWNTHVENNTVPEPIENADIVAEFVDGAYAKHRW